MRLVEKPAQVLGVEGGKWLKELVDFSIAEDDKFFKFQKKLRNLLAGRHWENVKNVPKDEIKMVVNLAHAHVRTLVPTLFFQNPTLDCAPTAPMYVGKETIWNGIVNNSLDKTGFAAEFKKAVLDAVVYQEGVVKDIVNAPSNPATEVGEQGPTVWLSKGAPIHLRISPSQLIVDYTVKDRDVECARFVAIRYRRLLSELKKHPIYKKNISSDFKGDGVTTPTVGNAVKASHLDSTDWEGSAQKKKNGANETMVTIYEVWIHQLISDDGKHECYQQMCVLMEGQDKPIRELTTWESVMGKGFDRFPVTRIVLNSIPDDKPQSELGITQDMQMALNWLVSRMTSLVENDRQLTAVDPTGVKNYEKFKQAFYRGRGRELVELTGGRNVGEVIGMIQPTFVGRDNYSLTGLLQQLYQQVGGIGQNRRGGSGIRTATEASLIDRGMEIKTDEKVDTVAKALINIMTKNIMMTRGLVSSSPGGLQWVFRVGGDVGAVRWMNFTKEDVDWLPEVRIRVNSFRKMDSTQEMQKFASIIQMSVQMFQLYGPTIRVDTLFKRFLESAGIFDAEKIAGNQDSQTMLQMIELSALIAGVEVPVTPDQNPVAHITVIDQFMQSQLGQQLMATMPELADRLAQHRQIHEQQLMEMQQKAAAAQAGTNPFEIGAGDNRPTEQSEGNSATAGDRSRLAAVPNGNGELA